MGQPGVINLRARALDLRCPPGSETAVLRVSREANRPGAIRRQEALVVDAAAAPHGAAPEGFAWYIVGSSDDLGGLPDGARAIVAPDQAAYLGQGDVVAIDPGQRALRVLHRASAAYNHFLLTERCNNYCLMCSQPPRRIDDGWIVDEILLALPLISRDAREIGFTGGEPSLLGERFLELVAVAGAHLPRTSLHILSNGRRFADVTLAQRLGAIAHHDLMVGIPLYSDLAHRHDHVVQADGAFDETVRGILALKASGVRVEIRIVLQAQTIERLPQLAEFIVRNLLFADHVALMGLEPTGFARANLDQIWCDPVDYAEPLLEAVRRLAVSGIRTSIYNSPLCVLPPDLQPYARRSISDWKQTYQPECQGCAARHECAGFFASVVHAKSRGIAPFADWPVPEPA